MSEDKKQSFAPMKRMGWIDYLSRSNRPRERSFARPDEGWDGDKTSADPIDQKKKNISFLTNPLLKKKR